MKNHKGENNPNYIDGRTYRKCYCLDCDSLISSRTRSGFCQSCSSKKERNGNYKHGKCFDNKCLDCGKKISYYNVRCRDCYKIELSKRYMGSGNPAYIDGKCREPYSLEFNIKLKEEIRARDNYECQGYKCSMTQEEHFIVYGRDLEVHHIDYDKNNNDENNLVTTCKQCNNRANYNRNYWLDFFKNIINKKQLIKTTTGG